MKLQVLKLAVKLMVVIAIAQALSSCGKHENNMREPNPTEQRRTLSQAAKYEAEVNSLMRNLNARLEDVREIANVLCMNISRMLDKQDALRLYDMLLEKAISYSVSDAAEYRRRQIQYEKLWFISFNAFVDAQSIDSVNTGRWDKMFCFFEKRVEEIRDIEEICRQGRGLNPTKATKQRRDYLRGIKGDLGLWLHVMRDLYFPRLSQGLTEEQKADILRRFDELQKYTAEPPDCIGRKIEAK